MKDTAQNEINRGVQGDIKELYRHAEVANGEMGLIKVDIGIMKNDISSLKDSMKKIDSRTWWILGTLIIGIALEIAFTFRK